MQFKFKMVSGWVNLQWWWHAVIALITGRISQKMSIAPLSYAAQNGAGKFCWWLSAIAMCQPSKPLQDLRGPERILELKCTWLKSWKCCPIIRESPRCTWKALSLHLSEGNTLPPSIYFKQSPWEKISHVAVPHRPSLEGFPKGFIPNLMCSHQHYRVYVRFIYILCT